MPDRDLEEDRQAVATFGELMLEKLRERSGKGGWAGCDIAWLFTRMEEEMNELYRSLEPIYGRSGGKDLEAARRECADVANFAMMIADNLTRARRGEDFHLDDDEGP